MSYKLICPCCDRYTSAIFRAMENGRNCPHCGGSLQAPRTIRSYYAQLPDDNSWPPHNTRADVDAPVGTC